MGERLWYYLQDNRQFGPIPQSALMTLVSQGTLPPDTLVWADGLATWVPAGSAGLVGRPAQAAAPDPWAGPAPGPGAAYAPALSPSEMVFFHGRLFGQAAYGGKFKLPTDGSIVSPGALAVSMLTAAVLANEQAGALRLQVGQKKAMLGLRTVNTVWAELTGNAVSWPMGSLEWSMLYHLTQRRMALEISDLVVLVLRSDSSDPHLHLLYIAMEGVAGRGLLDKQKVRTLGIFTSTEYHMNAAGGAALAAQPVEPVIGLLNATRQNRFDLLRLIEENIGRAMATRTESQTE